jgi:hypothetical protein
MIERSIVISMTRPEGEITREKIVATSLEVFGQENYGELAANIINTVQRASWINIWQDKNAVHASFEFSPYHFGGDGLSASEDIFKGSPSAVPMESIEAAVSERMDDEELLFDYMFVANPDRFTGYHNPIAYMIPLPWQTEGLAHFMTRTADDNNVGRSLAQHKLTGATGRAFDVLALASGVKTDVDPRVTDAGAVINYDEFRNGHLKREGVTPDVRKHLHETVRIAVMREAITGTNASPNYGLGHDVAIEGDSHIRGVGFSTSVSVDTIAVSSLKALGANVSNKPLKEAIESL